MKKSMEEKKKMPQIRFNGFNDDWEQRKLGEIAKYRNGKAHENNISKDGKYVVVNSKFVSTDGQVKKYSDEQIEPLYKGEIAFVLSDVPNGRAIARTFLVDKSKKYTLNQRIAGITPMEITDSYFLHILMNRNKYFLKFDDGAKQTNLSVRDVMSFEEKYPCYREQQQIGVYFKNLDNLITLHQHKCDQLRNLKKAMLKKMFPQDGVSIPELRFIGFTDTWEQRKLGTLCSLITKGTTPKDKSGNGEVNFIKVENIDIDNGEITSTSKISIAEHEGYLKRSKLKENDILFSIAGTLGRVSVVKSSILPANTNQALAILRINEGYIPYLTTVLKGQAVEDFIRRNPTIGAQPNLSLEQVNNLDISYPNYDEQVRIGQYFSNLDHLITLHQRKLEKLKVIKKSLLSKMFVDAD